MTDKPKEPSKAAWELFNLGLVAASAPEPRASSGTFSPAPKDKQTRKRRQRRKLSKASKRRNRKK